MSENFDIELKNRIRQYAKNNKKKWYFFFGKKGDEFKNFKEIQNKKLIDVNDSCWKDVFPNASCWKDVFLRAFIFFEEVTFIEDLLKAGADPNSGNGFQLYYAASCTRPEIGFCMSKLLLDFGADPNIGVPRSKALDIAIQRKNLAIISLLIERGADPSEYIL